MNQVTEINGINVAELPDFLVYLATNSRLVIGADDLDKARAAV
jgi:hypothetical protein